MTKIGIIIGSTRDGRFGDVPATWIREVAAEREGWQLELVDLRDHPLPAHFPSPDADGWRAVVARYDAYILVTPEYCHGPSPALLNALVHETEAWKRKPVAFVGYGFVGAARAIEQLRLVCNAQQMMPIATGVHICAGDFMAASRQGAPLSGMAHLGRHAAIMLDDLAWWTATLKAAR